MPSKTVSVCLVGALAVAIFLVDHTPRGKDCTQSISHDQIYMAELCVLQALPRDESTYIGRLYDAKTNKKLAQRTFSSPSPELYWSKGWCSQIGNEPKECFGPSVVFSRGDPDTGDNSIDLPPSWWDRLLAMRPRLFQ